MSVISRQSSFSTNAASEDGHLDPSARRRDPEDSETPWTCTVKVRRIAAAHHSRAHSHHSFGGEREWKKEVLRIKVGTLSPTPHHPKVVAMLKVPFPLPDVDVERMAVRKRDATGQGAGSGLTKPSHGLVITAEEIKDVVCSTGLWLVVNRKGDGWRIRG
ncbi:hypothetical protein B0H13DRAFT_2083436 [Mycena leptocephala]|nr:hypothetical protein B0H13DRAFT_2083436 [Mycena leptocephala]